MSYGGKEQGNEGLNNKRRAVKHVYVIVCTLTVLYTCASGIVP